jgi:phosphoribosylformylglycinamidine cyclo-ligase
MGKAVLSPTRTYLPVVKRIIDEFKDQVAGIVHCSGGGQGKCVKFGHGVHYVKDSLFDIPPLFRIIRETTKTPLKEMYQVFNMGHRMELYVPEKAADGIIKISESFGVDAKIVGHIEASDKNKVTLKVQGETIEY